MHVWCLELYLANAVDGLYDVVEKDLGCLLPIKKDLGCFLLAYIYSFQKFLTQHVFSL